MREDDPSKVKHDELVVPPSILWLFAGKDNCNQAGMSSFLMKDSVLGFRRLVLKLELFIARCS